MNLILTSTFLHRLLSFTVLCVKLHLPTIHNFNISFEDLLQGYSKVHLNCGKKMNIGI